MDNQEYHNRYYNHTPVPLKPRLTDHGQVKLCQVDGVGWGERADSASVITRSFVVRSKDVPRILGEGHTMLMNISEVSGASLSLSVDMRNVMNRTVQVNVWGRTAEVDEAEARIFNLITEVYDDPPFLTMLHEYAQQAVMVLPLNQALHLLRENKIVTLEAETFTWIDVDASKAWKKGAAVEVDIYILGASKRDIDTAVHKINEIVAQAEPLGGRARRAWTGRSVWNRVRDGVTYACNGMRERC